jgi:hypothetical protein
VENSVIEKTIEWNLAFARNEVVSGVEKLLAKLAYPFSCSESQEDFIFRAAPPQGTLSFTIRPLASHQSPFNIQVTLHRTMLITSHSGFSPQMEEALQRSLTLAFLRVGG